MFHIKIRNLKLLHSYPKNQICKKQILDAFPPPYTHTRAHIHTCIICTNKNKLRKKNYLQHKKANLQQKKKHQITEFKEFQMNVALDSVPTSSMPKFALPL